MEKFLKKIKENVKKRKEIFKMNARKSALNNRKAIPLKCLPFLNNIILKLPFHPEL